MRSRDGLYPYCRECSAVRKKSYRLANQDKILAYAARKVQAKREARYATDAELLARMHSQGMECRRCGQCKPLFEFGSKARNKFGLAHWCKACDAAARKDWYSRNAEHARQKARKRHHENRGAQLAKMKVRYQSDPSAARARSRAYEQTPKAKAARVAARINLNMTYVRETLVKHRPLLRTADIPRSLLELQRAHLMMLRALGKEDHEDR